MSVLYAEEIRNPNWSENLNPSVVVVLAQFYSSWFECSSFRTDRPRNLAVSIGVLHRFFTFKDVGVWLQLKRCSVVCSSWQFGHVSGTNVLGFLWILARKVFRYELYPECSCVSVDLVVLGRESSYLLMAGGLAKVTLLFAILAIESLMILCVSVWAWICSPFKVNLDEI